MDNPKNKLYVQHIDKDKSNNKVSNLRYATNSECQMRKNTSSRNTSGVIGVNYDKKANKWLAQISINNKNKHRDYFHTIEQAKKARLEAEKKYFGKYANK